MGKVVAVTKFKDKFTKDLKIGDFITSYNKGIHRVTKIERRFGTADTIYAKEGEEYAALISYEYVLNGNFEPAGKRRGSCDVSFCTKITLDYIKEQRRVFNKQMRALKELLI